MRSYVEDPPGWPARQTEPDAARTLRQAEELLVLAYEALGRFELNPGANHENLMRQRGEVLGKLEASQTRLYLLRCAYLANSGVVLRPTPASWFGTRDRPPAALTADYNAQAMVAARALRGLHRARAATRCEPGVG